MRNLVRKRCFSSIPIDQQATILKSGMCRTIFRHRPAPSLFFFPGLTAKPLWDPYAAPFDKITKALQASHDDLIAEYANIRKLEASDYIMSKQEVQTKLHHGEWDWNSYILKGNRQANFASSCPKTVELLESLSSPRLMTSTPFSYAFFSTLRAKSAIQAHYSPCNLRIRCHYPLIIPSSGDLGMRVAGNDLRWEERKPIFFDDSYEHEGELMNLPAEIILLDTYFE
jgi:aspartyl/asparaginyl beta-hydroxylase (cupin superfamily)